jgi:hypothetical protein
VLYYSYDAVRARLQETLRGWVVCEQLNDGTNMKNKSRKANYIGTFFDSSYD